MTDAVLVGLISVAGSIMVQLIVSAAKARESDARLAAHEQKQADALEGLKHEMEAVKKRLDMHNGYAEKFASASKDIALIQKDLEYLKRK